MASTNKQDLADAKYSLEIAQQKLQVQTKTARAFKEDVEVLLSILDAQMEVLRRQMEARDLAQSRETPYP